MSRSIIIDTDPGQDDAVAILLALASPELEVLGITTVAGNVPLRLTTRNALALCELARTSTRVYEGCSRPLVNDLRTAENVHGPSGLDGAELPPPQTRSAEQHGVDFIIETVRSRSTKSVTLCALGPLTNLAMAFVKAPDIVPMLAEVVLMGGGFFEGGNVTPAAEFNIFVDPHAASTVFRAGCAITMMPLDVTHKALATPERIEPFREMRTAVGDAVFGMLEFFDKYDTDKYGTTGAPLHDACVIAYLIEPTLFSGRMCSVAIEIHSPATSGMTLVDWWNVTEDASNAMVMNDVDADAMFDLIAKRLARL